MVVDALKQSGAAKVVDLGCGEGGHSFAGMQTKWEPHNGGVAKFFPFHSYPSNPFVTVLSASARRIRRPDHRWQIIAQAHANGLRVFGGTLTPF
jgi:hypothetical protein